MDTDSLFVYPKTDCIYEDIAEDTETTTIQIKSWKYYSQKEKTKRLLS